MRSDGRPSASPKNCRKNGSLANGDENVCTRRCTQTFTTAGAARRTMGEKEYWATSREGGTSSLRAPRSLNPQSLRSPRRRQAPAPRTPLILFGMRLVFLRLDCASAGKLSPRQDIGERPNRWKTSL